MPRKLLMGLETETSVLAPGGGDLDRQRIVGELLEAAARRFVHLPGHRSSGLFLENGFRLYGDTGIHLESATAEVHTPWEVVRWACAGDRMLAELAASRDVTIYKGNVDYAGATFGSHESYCHTSPPALLPSHLIPHLVTRTIISGAGGFNPLSPGIEFTLSPRAYYLQTDISQNSTSSRGIYHTKDEPLAGTDWHRAHLICGDSLQSAIALLLRFGTTALILAAVDGGLPVGQGLALEHPVQAMLTFAADPTCRTTAKLKDGRHVSAIQIQREYLAVIEAHCHDAYMPDWAPSVCKLWREELERLEQGYLTVAARLDWAIKYQMYTDYIGRKGFSWERILTCNDVLTCLKPGQLTSSSRMLRTQGLDIDAIESVLSLRQQLFEMDIRYSQLGEQGLFAMIDRTGVLDHRVPGLDGITEAMTKPPPGRAMIRGNAIRHLAQRKIKAVAEWTGVFDLKHDRFLDLTDPFASRSCWTAIPTEVLDGPSLMLLGSPDAYHFYQQGCLLRALEAIEAAEEQFRAAGHRLPSEMKRYKAWIHGRCGLLDAVSILDGIHRGSNTSLSAIGDYLQVYRYNYLTPRPEMQQWIDRARIVLDHSTRRDGQTVVCREYWAHYELSIGHVTEAHRLFKEAYAEERAGHADGRIVARLLCGLAECHRRLNDVDLARQELIQAGTLQRDGEFWGDWAHNLTCQAKLETDRTKAEPLLAQARTLQKRLGDRLGETRSLLLEARVITGRIQKVRRRAAVFRLSSQVPVLQVCPTFARIINAWTEWTRELSPDSNGDLFWGL